MLKLLTASIRRWRMKTHKRFGRPAADEIQLSLGDSNSEVATALAAAFADVDAVEVVEGNLLDLACDAIVSPANSFGDMSGGIDKAIDDFHGGAAQAAAMSAIAEQCFGELPVGSALIVPLATRRWPFIVVAPTMRIPSRVDSTINAYLAMRASLVAVLRHNAAGNSPIRSLAVPGLCTGVGAMPAETAAEQMRTAFDTVITGRWKQIVHPVMAPYALVGRHVEWSQRSDCAPNAESSNSS